MASYESLIVCLFLCIGLQLIAWLWQIKTENTDIVDITWSLLMASCGLIYFFYSARTNFHHYIILLIPVIWYGRLTIQLVLRYRIKHEDGRYRQLRAHWKHNTQTKYLIFFLFQAFLAFLFSISAYGLSQINSEPNLLDWMAIGVIFMALIGVTQSDWQLYQFKRNPDNKDQVCDRGWWRYSRHPNYFFEWLHWLAYPMLAFSEANFWYMSVLPLLMLIFLLKLTGIPFNEAQNIRSKGDKYRHYQNRTNKFFPFIPKY